MKKQKKANNIFEKQILHESLFHEEVEKEYRVGGTKIGGGWLAGTSPELYRSNLKSSLQLIEVHQKLAELKRKANRNDTVDMFRIAELEKKTENFQLMEASPTKPKKAKNFKIQAENLMLQKLSDYWGTFERQCHIQENNLFVLSQKQKKEKVIDLSPYTMELQEKAAGMQITKKFPWPENKLGRLVLFGQKLRTYCIYGDEASLKQIIKKNRIKQIQLQQTDCFKKLNQQYFNKIMISFGNKMRVFQHLMKEKNENNLDNAFDLLKKTNFFDDEDEEEMENQTQKESQKDSRFLNPKQSGLIEPDSSSNLSHRKSNHNTIHNSPVRGPSQNSSIFRLRSRRSTIHYDELQKEDQIYQSPNYHVKDITLDIKQATVSDEDLASINIDQNQDNYREQFQNQEQPFSPVRYKHKKSDIVMISMSSQQSEILESAHENDDFEEEMMPTIKKDRWKEQGKIKKPERYEKYQTKLTHEMHFGYFENFFPFPKTEIRFQIFQVAFPDLQYQNMKIPVTDFKEVIFIKDPEHENIFIPTQSLAIKCAQQFNEFVLLLKHGQFTSKHHFNIDLSIVRTSADESQFVYFREKSQKNNSIICAGKIKIAVCQISESPKPILEQLSTVDFLREYLTKKDNISKRKKYKFLNYKKRDCEIREKWHQKLMNKIIQKSDYKEFAKIIFYATSPKCLEKIKSKAGNNKDIEDYNSIYEKYYNSVDLQISKTKAINLRRTIPMTRLIRLINTMKKNEEFKNRYDFIRTFIRLKYGEEGESKLVAAMTIEIVKKIDEILQGAKNEEQIKLVLAEYMQVEYQLDSLFSQISAYFEG